jgi:isoleucyl-tRNA synthetase
MNVCNAFGADAVRLYLVDSPLVRDDSLNFSEEAVKDIFKNVFLPWYNTYRFLI